MAIILSATNGRTTILEKGLWRVIAWLHHRLDPARMKDRFYGSALGGQNLYHGLTLQEIYGEMSADEPAVNYPHIVSAVNALLEARVISRSFSKIHHPLTCSTCDAQKESQFAVIPRQPYASIAISQEEI